MAFSICEVVRVACQSHSCFVYAIDKPGDTASQMLKAMLENNLCSQDKPLWCSSVWLCPDSITTRTSHIYNKLRHSGFMITNLMRLSGACPIPDVFLFCVFLRTSSFTPGLLQLSVRQSILSSQESKRLSFYRPTGFRNIKGMRCAKKPRQVLTTTLLWNRTIAQPFLHVGKIVKWTGKTQPCYTFSPSKSSAIL